MHHNDVDLHAQGTSTFADDLTQPEGLLHAYPVVSEIAHGKLNTLICRMPWPVRVFSLYC